MSERMRVSARAQGGRDAGTHGHHNAVWVQGEVR